MEFETQNDFSGIPSLDDTQGLETYMQNQAMAAQGIQPTQPATTETVTTAANPTVPNQPVVETPTNGAQPTTPVQGTQPGLNIKGLDVNSLTQEQLTALATQVAQIQAQTKSQAPAAQKGYTEQEKIFISQALAQGYSLDKINTVIMNRRNGVGANADPAMAQRIASIENYIKQQEYKTAETTFINNLSAFGEKWGLSEQDLVTFGNYALSKGINIATPGMDLEMAFRAVYPEQYQIRSQRMKPTSTSQIFGGTSIPGNTRSVASKMEDAYVDQFLRNAMPSQFKK